MHYFFIFLTAFIFLGCGGGDGSLLDDVATGPDNTTVIVPNDTTIDAAPSTQVETPMLVIRLEYDNQLFVNNALTWSNKIFSSQVDSVNHYYDAVSNGKFSFTRALETQGTDNDGVITIHLNKNHPNADINSYQTFKAKVHPDLIAGVIEASNYMDFSQYDTDRDGNLTSDELTIIYIFAGKEDAYAGTHVTNGIWAHRDSTDDAAVVDGLSVLKYPSNFALFGERHEPTSSNDPYPAHNATIGIIAHELGHARFDLPDLYDTTSANGFGVGNFGYMGAGSWGQINYSSYPGSSPVHPTAWTELENNWVTPMTTAGTKTFYETASSTYNIQKINISGSGSNEVYYLIENRGNSGYDRGLYTLEGTFAGGMAIWKVDESIITAGTASNQINIGSNQGLKLIQAAFPRTSGPGHEKNLFYNGNIADYSDGFINVTNISTRGSSMSATIN